MDGLDFLIPFALAVVAIGALSVFLWYQISREPHTGLKAWSWVFVASIPILCLTLFAGLATVGIAPLSSSDRCGGEIAGPPTESLIPLSYVCHMADGTSRELVPPSVNAWLLAAAVNMVVCGAGLVTETYLRRRSRREDTPTSQTG